MCTIDKLRYVTSMKFKTITVLIWKLMSNRVKVSVSHWVFFIWIVFIEWRGFRTKHNMKVNQPSKTSFFVTKFWIHDHLINIFQAVVVLDTLVCAFSQYCEAPFMVEAVEVVRPNKEIKQYPTLAYRKEVINVKKVNKYIGIK